MTKLVEVIRQLNYVIDIKLQLNRKVLIKTNGLDLCDGHNPNTFK